MLCSNKNRVIFIYEDFSVERDMKVDSGSLYLPRIGELVVIDEVYFKVLNVIHSVDNKLTWVVIEKLIDEEKNNEE